MTDTTRPTTAEEWIEADAPKRPDDAPNDRLPCTLDLDTVTRIAGDVVPLDQ